MNFGLEKLKSRLMAGTTLNRSLNVMDGGHGPGRGMRMIMH